MPTGRNTSKSINQSEPPRAIVDPNQSERPNVKKQLSLHTNRTHIEGHNALVEIITDISNTRSRVISVLNPLKPLAATVKFYAGHYEISMLTWLL